MALERGDRLGPYEIVQPIDAGGMGEVYRAIDTRLDRPVAIKVLPERLAADPRRHERFAREAKAISSLTHPNICQLFDVGHAGRTPFLVMEYLDGQPLSLRLMAGPLPLPEALRIATEIASALASAHAHGIVHHDVKPSNIMLTAAGAKLLDFGLAREARLSGDTETLSGLSDQGAITGTLDYMAPEQLEGRQGDPRTDVWGLGTVLYEMLTGHRAFVGPSRGDVMAAVLTRVPDLSAIPDATVRHLVAKCLAKDAADRWQSAADLAEQLRWTTRDGVGHSRVHTSRVAIALALAAVVIAAAGVAGWKWRAPAPAPVSRLSIALPAGSRLISDTRGLEIAPDGSRVLFRAQEGSDAPAVYSRALDDFELTALPIGDAADLTFSPDGTWLAFVAGAQLFKVAATGGTPVLLSDLPAAPRGVSWAPDGTIYYATLDEGILAVSADGSNPRRVTTPDPAADENSHRLPHVLPGGRHLLFTIRTGRITTFDHARIAVLSLETGRWRTVLDGGFHASYLPTGHLTYMRENSLWAVAFDLEAMEVRGSPVRLVDDVVADTSTGIGQYAVAAATGTLVYARGEARPRRSEFQVLDRRGVVTRTFVLPQIVDRFRVSPDARRIAVQVSAANDDIYSYDVERETLTRVSQESGNEFSPAWNHDGTSVFYSNRNGLHRRRVDGVGPPELVAGPEGVRIPDQASSSPDGDLIAYELPRQASSPPVIRFLRSGNAGHAQPGTLMGGSPELAPCGRWIAYVSDETGRAEVYVQHLRADQRLQASRDGGTAPRWSRDCRELYYRFGDGFFAVPVAAGPSLSVGRPALMFRRAAVSKWDVIGREFLLLGSTAPPVLDSGIHVIDRWGDEVRAKVPRR